MKGRSGAADAVLLSVQDGRSVSAVLGIESTEVKKLRCRVKERVLDQWNEWKRIGRDRPEEKKRCVQTAGRRWWKRRVKTQSEGDGRRKQKLRTSGAGEWRTEATQPHYRTRRSPQAPTHAPKQRLALPIEPINGGEEAASLQAFDKSVTISGDIDWLGSLRPGSVHSRHANARLPALASSPILVFLLLSSILKHSR